MQYQEKTISEPIAKVHIEEINEIINRNERSSLPFIIFENEKKIEYKLSRSKMGKYRLEK